MPADHVSFDFVQETGFLSEAYYQHLRADRELVFSVATQYPCSVEDPFSLDAPPNVIDEMGEGNWRGLWWDGSGLVAIASVGYGLAHIRASAPNATRAKAFLEEIKQMLPRHEPKSSQLIGVTFWTYTKEGPRGTRRDLTAPTWKEIGGDNYAAETRDRLEVLMDPAFRPGRSGQLILWHGKPGTGKTTALRALGQEWKDWAELHVITDPDQFFGNHADYMMEVMLGAGSVEEKGDEDADADPGKWRVLILEDSGELLRKDAKADVGAALSRFLNAVDGLIGQGLRVMTMVTTNEDLGALNEAVTRHGRAASEIHFTGLSVLESADLLERLAGAAAVEGARLEHGMTLAEVYAIAENRATARPQDDKSPVGFGVR